MQFLTGIDTETTDYLSYLATESFEWEVTESSDPRLIKLNKKPDSIASHVTNLMINKHCPALSSFIKLAECRTQPTSE